METYLEMPQHSSHAHAKNARHLLPALSSDNNNGLTNYAENWGRSTTFSGYFRDYADKNIFLFLAIGSYVNISGISFIMFEGPTDRLPGFSSVTFVLWQLAVHQAKPRNPAVSVPLKSEKGNNLNMAANAGPIRKAFVMSVNEGQAEEYEKRHNPIWPELEEVRPTDKNLVAVDMACSLRTSLLRAVAHLVRAWQ